MNHYSLLLAAAGTLCAGDGLFGQQAAVEPLQVVEMKSGMREGFDLSPDGRFVRYFDRDWAMHRIDLGASGADKKLPLPRELRGEGITTAIHVQDDVWFLAMRRWAWDVKTDGFKTRFVLYDFAADKKLADWAAHKDDAPVLAFAPKQAWFITGEDLSDDLTVCFWDRKTQKKVAEMDLRQEFHLRKGNGMRPEKMAIDPTSSFLAVCMTGGVIRVWDLEKKTWRSILEEGDRVCPSIGFLDSDTIALDYGTMKFGFLGGVRGSWHAEVYDWKSAKLLFRVEGASQIVPSPDGRVTALRNGRTDGSWISLWDMAAKKEVAAFKAYDDGLRNMAFSKDGKRLVTIDSDEKLKVWDVDQILNPSKP